MPNLMPKQSLWILIQHRRNLKVLNPRQSRPLHLLQARQRKNGLHDPHDESTGTAWRFTQSNFTMQNLITSVVTIPKCHLCNPRLSDRCCRLGTWNTVASTPTILQSRFNIDVIVKMMLSTCTGVVLAAVAHTCPNDSSISHACPFEW